MQRAGIQIDNEDLIRAAAGDERLPVIDVKDRVMERIGSRKGGGSWLGFRLMNRAGALTMLLAMLLISTSAYAASEWIQIRNAADVVKVQYEPEYFAPEPVAQWDPYQWKALNSAKSGELVAYYVKGQNDDDASSSSDLLHFAVKERRFTSYPDFVKEMRRTGVTVLPEKVEGYTLKYGNVSPHYPLTSSTVYRQTLGELINQANQAKAGQRLFAKKLPWTDAGSVGATYANGRAYVDFGMTLLQGGTMRVEQESENQTDKFKIEGRAAVYNDVKKENVSYHYLNWYDEKRDAYYTLTTYGDRILTREQLVQLAEELINDGI
ncbi:hypothetical protein PASE110613_00090 [Paenibacillus sediminis]|uniref:DUF4367 domain-containing protein n=1 Tax=Paenibacillus sediminis TaxID=664909 RepID=A0ABS4H172_9BACL|nr:hypothetical protein [Paenibacillus sediminis]MBP1936022.1 hypothetical protein [Paenibacillus sediminis]